MEKHPILIPNGFQIWTKPVESTANSLLSHIESGHHGCSIWGGGGLGKTSAQQYLTDHASLWLIDEKRRPMGVACRMIMPSGARRSDRAFYAAVNDALRVCSVDRLSAAKSKQRLVNFIKTRCGQLEQDLMVLFIDNAQRITRAEFDYLADIDEQITDANLHLFLAFFRQSDASGVEIKDDWSDYPTHMMRRWFMGSHAFLPLIGLIQIKHALERFDTSIFWPTPDMPYSRFFAQQAYDDNWRLSHETQLILQAINEIREAANIPPSDAWPMATFIGTVRHLLTVIAPRTPGFRGFKIEQIKEALSVSSYLRLEYVRANLTFGPKDFPNEDYRDAA